MTDHNLFQEIQEDLDRQKLEAFWKKYGFWIIVAALGLVISTASSTAYRSWRDDRDRKQTTAFLSAASVRPDPAQTVAALQKYAGENAGANLASYALLRAGAAAVEKNDREAAIGLFDKAAADSSADPAFRDLGVLLSVQMQLDKGDPAALSSRLAPLVSEKAPWRFSALEAQALLALRADNKAGAKKIFTELSQDPRAPQSISARASDILRTLN